MPVATEALDDDRVAFGARIRVLDRVRARFPDREHHVVVPRLRESLRREPHSHFAADVESAEGTAGIRHVNVGEDGTAIRSATSATSSAWPSSTSSSTSSSQNSSTGNVARAAAASCQAPQPDFESLGPAFHEPVGVQDDRAPGRQGRDGLGSRPVGMRHPERPASCALQERRRLVGFHDEDRWVPGRRVPQRSVRGVDDPVEQRRRRGALDAVREAVEPRDGLHCGIRRARDRAQGAAELSHGRGGIDPAADDVADGDRDPVPSIGTTSYQSPPTESSATAGTYRAATATFVGAMGCSVSIARCNVEAIERWNSNSRARSSAWARIGADGPQQLHLVGPSGRLSVEREEQHAEHAVALEQRHVERRVVVERTDVLARGSDIA